jgi:hypothetical protein
MIASNEEEEVRRLLRERQMRRDLVEAKEHGSDGEQRMVLSRPRPDAIGEADYD